MPVGSDHFALALKSVECCIIIAFCLFCVHGLLLISANTPVVVGAPHYWALQRHRRMFLVQQAVFTPWTTMSTVHIPSAVISQGTLQCSGVTVDAFWNALLELGSVLEC